MSEKTPTDRPGRRVAAVETSAHDDNSLSAIQGTRRDRPYSSRAQSRRWQTPSSAAAPARSLRRARTTVSPTLGLSLIGKSFGAISPRPVGARSNLGVFSLCPSPSTTETGPNDPCWPMRVGGTARAPSAHREWAAADRGSFVGPRQSLERRECVIPVSPKTSRPNRQPNRRANNRLGDPVSIRSISRSFGQLR